MNCPDTHPDVLCQLCDLYCLPGKCERLCNAHFRRWMETEPEVQRLHKEYMKAKKEETKEMERYSQPLRVIKGGKER